MSAAMPPSPLTPATQSPVTGRARGLGKLFANGPSYFIPGVRMVGPGYVMNAPLTAPITANIMMAATTTTAV